MPALFTGGLRPYWFMSYIVIHLGFSSHSSSYTAAVGFKEWQNYGNAVEYLKYFMKMYRESRNNINSKKKNNHFKLVSDSLVCSEDYEGNSKMFCLCGLYLLRFIV